MTSWLMKMSIDVALELKRIDPIEKPCRDMDMDCLAIDGIPPFGDYNRCYNYDPGQGKCPFADSDTS